jgi:hypothetical protein
MPEATKKEVGRRLYLVHREKRIENAMKKMKITLGADWKVLTQDEIRILGHLLQCTWNVIDQKVWDTIPFGKITKTDIDKILCHGEGVCPGNNPPREAVEEIKNILISIS